MKVDTEIRPNIGIDKINFSMSPNLIERYLGVPDSIDESDDREIVFSYENLGINIIFISRINGWVISNIEFELPAYTLWGVNIIGMEFDSIQDLLKDKGCTNFRVEKHGDSQQYIFCDKYNIDFEFENKVASVVYLNNPDPYVINRLERT